MSNTHKSGPRSATADKPERSGRFSVQSYNESWNTIGADGDVCGSQPARKADALRTGWDHEAMRE